MPLQKLFVCAHVDWDEESAELTRRGRQQATSMANTILANTIGALPTIFLSPHRRVMRMMDCMRGILGNANEVRHNCFQYDADRDENLEECLELMRQVTANTLIVVTSPRFGTEIAFQFGAYELGLKHTLAQLGRGEFWYLTPAGTAQKMMC